MPRRLWWAATSAVAWSALAGSCHEQGLAVDDDSAVVRVALLQSRLERLAAAPEASGGPAAAAPTEGRVVEEGPAALETRALEASAASEAPWESSRGTRPSPSFAAESDQLRVFHSFAPQVVAQSDGGTATVLWTLALGLLLLSAACLVPPAARIFHQQITLWVFGGSEEQTEEEDAATQGDSASPCDGSAAGGGAAALLAAPPPGAAAPQASSFTTTLPDELHCTAPDQGTVAAVLRHAGLEDKLGVERSRSHRQLDLLGFWHTASERKVFDLRLAGSIGVVCFFAIALREADTFSKFWHTTTLQPTVRLLLMSLSENVWHVMLIFLVAGYYDASHYKHLGFRDLLMLSGLAVIPLMQFVAEVLPFYLAVPQLYDFHHPLRWMLQMFLLARVHVVGCRWVGLSVPAQLVLAVPYRAMVCYAVALLQDLETNKAISYLVELLAVNQGRALTTGMAIMTYTLAFGLTPLLSQTVARFGPRTTRSERLLGALLWAALLVLNVLGTDTGFVPSAEGAYVSMTYPPIWPGNPDLGDDKGLAGGTTVFVAIIPLGLPLVLLQVLLFVAAFAFLPPFVPRVAANSLIAALLCIGVCVAPLPLQMLWYFTAGRSAPEQVVAIFLWMAFFLCVFFPLSQWIFMSLMRGAGTLTGHVLHRCGGNRGPPHTPPGRSPLASEQNSCRVSREHSRLSREPSRLSREHSRCG